MLLLAVNGTKGGKLSNGITTKLEQAAYFYAKKLKMSEEDSFIEIKRSSLLLKIVLCFEAQAPILLS